MESAVTRPSLAEPSNGGAARVVEGHGSKLALMARDPLRTALFVLTLISISHVHLFFGPLGRLRPALVLAAFAGVYALLHPRQVRTGNLTNTWTVKVLAGLAIAACLSVPFGISMGGSAVYILGHFSKVVIYAFLVIVAIRHARDLALFIWGYVISAGILVLLSFTIVGRSLESGATGEVERLSGLYGYDPNDLSLVLVVGLPLTLFAVQTSRGVMRVVSILTMVGIGATIAFTGSRGGFLALAAVGAALLVFLTQVSLIKRAAFVFAVASAVLLAAPQGYWERLGTIASPTRDYNWDSVYGRRQITLRGLKYMLEHPLTGLGIGNFPRAEGTISDFARNFEDRIGRRVRWAAAHNSYVEAGAELGIPGLILWTCLVWGGIVSTLRTRRRVPKTWAKGNQDQRIVFYASLYIPVALIGFAVGAAFLSFAYLPQVYYLAALTAGLLVCAPKKTSASRPAVVHRQGNKWMQRTATPNRMPPRLPSAGPR
jgi:O-antigen ligase